MCSVQVELADHRRYRTLTCNYIEFNNFHYERVMLFPSCIEQGCPLTIIMYVHMCLYHTALVPFRRWDVDHRWWMCNKLPVMFPGKIPKKLVAPTQSMVAALKSCFFCFFWGVGFWLMKEVVLLYRLYKRIFWEKSWVWVKLNFARIIHN